MATGDELIALAERCEAATGPDRELDCLTHCAVNGWEVRYEGLNIFADMGPTMSRILVGWLDPGKVQRNFSMTSNSMARPYTASLDAALTLVPTDWHVDLRGVNRSWGAFLNATADGQFGEASATAATPALALCAAALRARANHA